jgi:hypothetical protein
MKKQLLYLLIGLFFNLNASAIFYSEVSNRDLINDGPYIFFVNNELKVKWIKKNVLREDIIRRDNFPEIMKKFNLSCNYDDLKNTFMLKPEYRQSYAMVDSIGIITDIHGEYSAYINLLKAIGIIDGNLNWKFGKGHLVVLGDIFDRGSMVTEVFWHLYGLEKQAERAGGMVHLLLGNHEMMVLSKDLRYINEKYRKVEEISNTSYCDLYADSSVLGKWLRSKPVVITINNILFVHAGISIEMVQRNLKVDQINQIFSNKIVGKDHAQVYNNDELIFLDDDNGPIWYRGYFTDKNFSETKIDSILNFYGKDHIVVGHTPNQGIKSLFNSKIIGSDTGITIDQPGEMLIYKEGSFYKGSTAGNRIKVL